MRDTAFIRSTLDPVDGDPCDVAGRPVRVVGNFTAIPDAYLGTIAGKHRPKQALRWGWIEPGGAWEWAAEKGYEPIPDEDV